MPKRTDLHKILIIGSGPIVIGQACEFDYSGTQGCKSLRQEGYEVVLINSNPATIMTDPEFGDRTYVEPITPDIIEQILAGMPAERRQGCAAEPDRARAIRLAIAEARPDDLVLIAGKGHEDYQIFADRTIHFDDREVAEAAIHEVEGGPDA